MRAFFYLYSAWPFLKGRTKGGPGALAARCPRSSASTFFFLILNVQLLFYHRLLSGLCHGINHLDDGRLQSLHHPRRINTNSTFPARGVSTACIALSKM